MRRLLAVVAIVVTCAGCLPGFFSGEQGWWQARGDNKQSIRVAPIPKWYAFSDADVIDPINRTAGWQLLVIDTVDPQVTFEAMTPICAYNTVPCDRRAAWVQRHLNSDGSYWHVTINVDPQLSWQLDPHTLAHELVHAVGFSGAGCESGYRGAATHCGWWPPLTSWPPGWWQSDDKRMFFDAGYGFWAG